MKIRRKPCVIGCGLFLLIGASVLAVVEWDRRRQAAVAGPMLLEGSVSILSAQDLQAKYQDPEAFTRLCADVQERSDALRDRFHRLQHTRKARLIEYDRKGQTASIMELIDQVGFQGGEERKKEIERRQLLGKPFPFDPDLLRAEHPKMKATPPFSNDAPEGLYRYRFEGVEELHGRLVLRIHFEPSKPVERTFTGSAWIDPGRRDLVRIHGVLAKNPILVDRFEMAIDYGPSENGHTQIRHIRIDARGGLAFIVRHYGVEAELMDYRAEEP